MSTNKMYIPGLPGPSEQKMPNHL